MFANRDGGWRGAAAVVVGGLFLGGGGFGLFRVASAEPVPAAPPQFLPTVPLPPVVPATGIVPVAPAAPAAMPSRPGDLLPVPELPSGPRVAEDKSIPMKASDLPKVPDVPVEVLPLPKVELRNDPIPAPVTPLPAPKIDAPKFPAPVAAPVTPLPAPVADEGKLPSPKPAREPLDPIPPLPSPIPADVKPAAPKPVKETPGGALPFPVPAEIPQPTPPAKSAQPSPVNPPAQPGLTLQPSEPRHNVKTVEPVSPAKPPASPQTTIEFPAAPTVELNKPTDVKKPVESHPKPAPPGVPASRVVEFPPTPPGDAPMPLSLRTLSRAAVLGAALLGTPALAEDPKPTDTVKYADLDPLKQQIKDIQKDIKELKDAIEGRADRGGLTDDGLVKMVKKLQATLDGLDKKLQSMENRLSDPTRTAGSSPITGGASPAIVTRSTVKVVNEYPVEISILVNGVPHRVGPNSTKEIGVAPGTFKYQLLTSGAAETPSNIKDGETVTLRVR